MAKKERAMTRDSLNCVFQSSMSSKSRAMMYEMQKSIICNIRSTTISSGKRSSEASTDAFTATAEDAHRDSAATVVPSDCIRRLRFRFWRNTTRCMTTRMSTATTTKPGMRWCSVHFANRCSSAKTPKSRSIANQVLAWIWIESRMPAATFKERYLLKSRWSSMTLRKRSEASASVPSMPSSSMKSWKYSGSRSLRVTMCNTKCCRHCAYRSLSWAGTAGSVRTEFGRLKEHVGEPRLPAGAHQLRVDVVLDRAGSPADGDAGGDACCGVSGGEASEAFESTELVLLFTMRREPRTSFKLSHMRILRTLPLNAREMSTK
mmetsp:Transcript_24481/g.70288  ORF Transcript_24481/g.70288 Transcript_24481/m.70288 type:complete len:319 (+) Transcript_24481:633-1589(+)